MRLTMITTVSVNEQGQMTLPKWLCEELGLTKGSTVQINLQKTADDHIIQLIMDNSNNTLKTTTDTLYSESVSKVGGILNQYVHKKLTIDEINEGIAQGFANMDKEK